jgi:carbon monoxide dehydrogenase subunit G
MIEISERVEVPAVPRIVWGVLSDPHAVVDCVPGAKLGDRLEDGSYDATVTVKFGPAKVTFRAKVALELDGTAMIGHVSSRGRDDQGGTRVKTAMTFKVVAGQAPGSSAVPIDAQVEISGRLASLVESGAALVVKRMTVRDARYEENPDARYEMQDIPYQGLITHRYLGLNPHHALVIAWVKERKHEGLPEACCRFRRRRRHAHLWHHGRRQHVLDARAGQARRRQDARSAP